MVRRFQASVLDPAEAQAAALSRVLDAARGTAIGGRLRAVRTLAEYRTAIPVQEFPAHAEDLRAVAGGEGRRLVRHPVRSFVKTSGTTGEPKLLPVTAPWAKRVAEAQALWVVAMVKEQEDVIRDKALAVVGPAVEGRTPSGVTFGSNTGRMLLAQSFLVRRRYAVPYDVHTIPETDLRHYILLRIAIGMRVRTWTTANPSTILALCRAAERWREELAADLADGTLRRGPAAGLSSAQRRRWCWSTRARGSFAEPLGKHWPLVSVNCWKGGAAPYFVRRLPRSLGVECSDTFRIREVGISASEGYFAIPLHSTWTGGVAWTAGHLLELVPEEGGDAIAIYEAETGRDYRLVLSTTSGLYRYDLNDIVRVVGFYHRAPVIRFLRKGRDVLSVTGEKVTAEQVVEAAGELIPDARGFAVGVRIADRSTYVLAVEGRSPERLAEMFDVVLRRLNPEYDGKRESDRLTMPEVATVVDGTFQRHRASRLAAGAVDGQVKDLVLVHGSDLDRLLGGWC